ncbi:MAG: DEAD/DEAH box helicase, partial [bacterium]|nr:DEAD/DEAH box helicase [bacterium]
MVKPFAHQRQCLRTLENIRGNTKKIERKALIVMASGLGKTVTSALDVKKIMAHFPWLRVLYLCHQNYILKQARETFELVLGNQNGKTFGYYHGLKKEIEAQLLFASFQTMRDSLDKFRKNAFDYVVVDESHHVPAETFHPVVRHFKPRFMLGMTATPDRMDMQDIRKTFGTEIFSLDLPDALAQKLLTAVDYRIVTDEIVKLGEIKNPYRLSMKELNRRIFVPKRDREIVKIIEQKIQAVKNPKVMIFCPSIRYAEKLRKKIIWSTTIHSQLPQDEQERRLEAFHQGKYDTVLTVDKFNEGIDIPEINVLVFLRSTQSHTVFYQQLGRGLRKLPGKKKVLVLDFVANCERVELIHELVEEVKKKTPR